MGKEEKRKISGYVGGALPLGYSVVDKIIEINPTTSVIVNLVFKLRGGGLSMRGICKKLTELNITPVRGKAWYASSIKCILDNKDKYLGGLINNNENNICWPIIIR